MKLGGSFIVPFWRELCHWETFFGYVEYTDNEALLPKVGEWLLEEKEIGKGTGGDAYCQLMFF